MERAGNATSKICDAKDTKMNTSLNTVGVSAFVCVLYLICCAHLRCRAAWISCGSTSCGLKLKTTTQINPFNHVCFMMSRHLQDGISISFSAKIRQHSCLQCCTKATKEIVIVVGCLSRGKTGKIVQGKAVIKGWEQTKCITPSNNKLPNHYKVCCLQIHSTTFV